MLALAFFGLACVDFIGRTFGLVASRSDVATIGSAWLTRASDPSKAMSLITSMRRSAVPETGTGGRVMDPVPRENGSGPVLIKIREWKTGQRLLGGDVVV